MHRRNFLQHASLLTTAFLFRAPVFGRGLLQPSYKVTPLRGNVSIFTERGGTIAFVLNAEGAAVIDAQFPDTAPHLLDEINRQATAPIVALLNTHHHGDHTSGNIAFRNRTTQVIAHENCATNLKNVSEKQKTADKQFFPTQTFTKKCTCKVGDEKIAGYYFGAGHTNGDAVYHFTRANVIHLGDLLFNKRHPFVDRSTGANMESWIKVLDKVLRKGDKETLYVFGHSLTPGEETGSAENIRLFQDYLHKVLQFAEAEWKRGVSKEEFLKQKAIPGVTLWSGSGIERPLAAAYDEVAERNSKR